MVITAPSELNAGSPSVMVVDLGEFLGDLRHKFTPL